MLLSASARAPSPNCCSIRPIISFCCADVWLAIRASQAACSSALIPIWPWMKSINSPAAEKTPACRVCCKSTSPVIIPWRRTSMPIVCNTVSTSSIPVESAEEMSMPSGSMPLTTSDKAPLSPAVAADCRS